MFLDDLQWADAASLKLIEIILVHEAADHLLIIGAYRNTEVTETHSLTLTLEQLEKRSIHPDQIDLGGLTLEDITSLILDAFPQAREDAAPLARLLLTKTRGNYILAG
jgi:predicted ATPase